MNTNKFGMFIHWGIYSLGGRHEQEIARFDIPNLEYEKNITRFNPTSYDPESWVLLAKKAGMEYICFTTKHHDGFCMWDTKYTDYNIMNTPYGKDVLLMLSEACKKHGMKLSLYYSNPDWNHPKGYNPDSTHQWKSIDKEHPDTIIYREFIRNQVRELLTNYGEIYTFFWDIPALIYDPSMNEFVRSLQPGIIINNRGWDDGDFSTPERNYATAEGHRFTRMTEACNSVGEQSWGYRSDEDFYSIRYLISSIDHIMAMGGSYLLNVGPTPLGEIAPEYVRHIERIGDWYCRMNGALVAHEEDTFDYGVENNDCIVTKKDGKSYFHFYDGLISSAVSMRRFPNLPKSVLLLNTGEYLKFKIEQMPEWFDMKTGIADTMLHISGIPTDELVSEAIVIEITW